MSEAIRTVRVDEFEPFMRYLERCYKHPEGHFPSAYPHLYRPDTDACSRNFVIESNGRILSHVGVYPLDMVVNGVEIRIAGIGGVSTLQEERGNGLMTRLLRHAVQVMRNEGFAASFLSGDRQRYKTFGWDQGGQGCRLQFTGRSLDRAGVQPVPLAETAPEEAVATVEELQIHPGYGIRREHVALQLKKKDTKLLVGDGYVVVRPGKDQLLVLDLVSSTGHELGMIRTLLGDAGGQPASWHLPAWDKERLSRVLPGASSWCPEYSWMFRVVSLPQLLTVYAPLLSERAQCVRDFEVSIGVRDAGKNDIVTIRVRDGVPEVLEGKQCGDLVEMDPATATRTFLGALPPPKVSGFPEGLAAMLPLPVYISRFDEL